MKIKNCDYVTDSCIKKYIVECLMQMNLKFMVVVM